MPTPIQKLAIISKNVPRPHISSPHDNYKHLHKTRRERHTQNKIMYCTHKTHKA